MVRVNVKRFWGSGKCVFIVDGRSSSVRSGTQKIQVEPALVLMQHKKAQ
jgi:hypothetical protein